MIEDFGIAFIKLKIQKQVTPFELETSLKKGDRVKLISLSNSTKTLNFEENLEFSECFINNSNILSNSFFQIKK